MAAQQKRRRKAYTPRLIRIPVTGLRNEFGMQMHLALACLERQPDQGSFDALAETFDLLQIMLERDSAHAHEARLITGGAATLVQVRQRVARGVPPQAHEIASIRVGVNTIDGLLGRLDVTSLYAAMRRLKAIRAADARKAA